MFHLQHPVRHIGIAKPVRPFEPDALATTPQAHRSKDITYRSTERQRQVHLHVSQVMVSSLPIDQRGTKGSLVVVGYYV
jgi:hypothetical protein